MRRFGLSCLAVFFVLSSAQFASAKGAKSAKVAKSKGPAPVAKDAAHYTASPIIVSSRR